MVKHNAYKIISGAPDGYDGLLIAEEFRRAHAPFVYVAQTGERAEALRTAVRLSAPEIPLLRFSAWDCAPYEHISPHPEICAKRMGLLKRLTRNASPPSLLITTINAITQRLAPREIVAQNEIILKKDTRLAHETLLDFLTRTGYSKAPNVMEAGDFSVRGGLIDIFPATASKPIRLDFFGDTLDQIRIFDPTTQKTLKTTDHIALTPVSDVILDAQTITHFRKKYRTTFGAEQTRDLLYEDVSAGRRRAGIEHWLGFFYAQTDTIFDYTHGSHIIFDGDPEPIIQKRWEYISEQYEMRARFSSPQNAPYSGKDMSALTAKPAPPESLYIPPEAFKAHLESHHVSVLSPFAKAPSANASDAQGRIGREFSAERAQRDKNLFSALARHIEKQAETDIVIIASFSHGARERIHGLLTDEGLHKMELVDDLQKPLGKRGAQSGGIYLVIWPLAAGFTAPGLTVISERDILGERLVSRPRKQRRAENFLREANAMSAGDFVVHIDNGIGRYLGIETILAEGAPHDCLALEYAGGDRLLVPVENIELLSPYGQENAELDKLGGARWKSRKAQTKKKIKEIAGRLMRIAAERAVKSAPILGIPEDMWDAFSARFAHQETEDQLTAIADVLEDLERAQPMDRLICGDVGFGKTEIAMRAAFIAVMAGWQVAVIAPTTLLARQHFVSFCARFQSFGVKIRQLSRLVLQAQATKTREELANGEADIVIGTHALLSDRIKIHNLGLLVIDEEQKFGVAHKEKLKQMRTDVHVLTMSATPIPRTLQFALSGIRDLSIISTPPIDRRAIHTYVSAFDPITIREALLREFYRGGQSFFVVPRIRNLAEIETFVKDQLPELKFVVAHGQMAPSELEKRINAFYEGHYDLLLCTTIIESGIDIANANTIIIHHADYFGLAQLYQIRGRVGRSNKRAYAYLTTNPRKTLGRQAEKRLRILGSLDKIGAGFALASQDLDLRGAGSLVGESQSGHARDVGYALYHSMLEEAIAEIKAGGQRLTPETQKGWAPQINMPIPILIPEAYVEDVDIRLGLYRRLSVLNKKVEFEAFGAELIDRFGALPKEVTMLLRVVRIKVLCKRAGIERFDCGVRGATIRFYKDKFASPKGLADFLNAQKGLAKYRDNKITVRRDWRHNKDMLQGAFAIARDLSLAARQG